MDSTIALILVQDGIVNGAIYALLAMALVLVFAVTRVILIPQGEFVAFGALTLAMLVNGAVPGTVWLLLLAGVTTFLMEVYACWRIGRYASLIKTAAACVVYPLVMLALVNNVAARDLPLFADVVLTMALVVP